MGRDVGVVVAAAVCEWAAVGEDADSVVYAVPDAVRAVESVALDECVRWAVDGRCVGVRRRFGWTAGAERAIGGSGVVGSVAVWSAVAAVGVCEDECVRWVAEGGDAEGGGGDRGVLNRYIMSVELTYELVIISVTITSCDSVTKE